MRAELTHRLKISDVAWSVHVEQDNVPVRGNASCWNDGTDEVYAQSIIERLDDGDAWAWAQVEVRGTYKGLRASDYLCGCNYRDEADFCQPGGYYDDMRGEVLARLQAAVDSIVDAANPVATTGGA